VDIPSIYSGLSSTRVLSSNAPLGDAMNVGFRVLRDNGLRLDPAFTLAVKAMVQAEVIATTLWPQGGILTRGYEIAERLL
jgi:hypothetical protein